MTKREKVLLWVLVGVFVLSGGSLTYAYRDNLPFIKKATVDTTTKTSTTDTATTSETTASPTTAETDTTATNNPSVPTAGAIDAGVTWVTPQKLANLDLIRLNTDAGITSAAYYKIADLADGGSLILADVTFDGPYIGKSFFRFRKTADGKYYYLLKQSALTTMSEVTPILVGYSQAVDVDSTSAYVALSSPDVVVTDKNISFNKVYGDYFFSDLASSTKIDETNYGAIYEVLTQPNSGTTSEAKLRSNYLKHADGTVTAYTLSIGFVSDDNVPNVTFSTGVKNTDKYFESILYSACGNLGATSVIKTNGFSERLQEYGTTSTGEKIYSLKNANDPILATAYDTYKAGRDNPVSMAEFTQSAPVFLWQDAYNDYVTFFNQKYAPLGECGKPVIYLYPEKETKVSVSVGADITKSEPAYNGGWEAIAKPNGMLTVGEKNYPYLFWEGIGKGYYPAPDQGFVVARSDVETTLKAHLTKLGLNQKESADFLDYWLPKMPTSPYIRLTWFGTSTMNQLAPLSINPKPDTMIRIFLDFQGLNEPITIKPQTLASIPRKGFTVVEWGGLLK